MEATEQFPVLVSNLDLDVTEKQISDFFSFCGKITSLTIRTKGNNVEAILFFEHESSAKTALLLSNALINDKPIVVQKYTDEKQAHHDTEDKRAQEKIDNGEVPELKVEEADAENITHRGGGHRTATATIASLIAGGYVLASDAIGRAKHFDEQNHITESVNHTTESMKNRAASINTQYGISEKASNTSRQISDQWNSFDNQYHISENAASASASVGNTMNNWGAAIANGLSNTLQQPSVQSTLSSVSQWTNSIGTSIGNFLQPAADTVSREYNDIKEQSQREIEAKKREREQHFDIKMEELDVDLGEETPNPKPVDLTKKDIPADEAPLLSEQ